ncbi:MAG: beta-glucosidase [Planctomycetales bacterium]|nr:beta-glucosidase [Planctomycetales bacterium]
MAIVSSETAGGFPKGFVWGVSTSAYQIEGATREDGREASVWDTFCQREGAVLSGDTADVTCDHYHRFREDVKLMSEFQVPAYRLSISWPRVMSTDSSQPNELGLAFYDALIDELLAAGISPWVTLFHWDFPQSRHDQGGWLNPRCVDWFAEYASTVVERLSDRVTQWITVNEPQCFLHFGHGLGINAPGVKLSLADQLTAAHHVLLAHGRAVAIIREHAKLPPQVGWAPVGITCSPATEDRAHQEAARRATMDVKADNLWNNTWFSDPVFLGHYPEEGLRAYGKAAPKYAASDMQHIAAPLDFLGLNIYTAMPVESQADGSWSEVSLAPGTARTAFDWPVREECLYWGPKFHAERYGVPIVITENGMANIDWPARDGRVHDPQRIDYLHRHLLALHRGIVEGVDVRGYFHWSWMDNFEWAEGFRRRFGLIYVDFESGLRRPKDSAAWYREVIRSHGRSLFTE